MNRRGWAWPVALLLAAACSDGNTRTAAPATATVTVTATSTATPVAARTSASASATSATSAMSATPATPAETASTSVAPAPATSPAAKPTATSVALKQWLPDHGVVATRWPAQKCELPTTRDNVIPHFDTPQQAMTFLTEAYNCYDIVALKRVTVAAARDALLGMTSEATNLKLDNCVPNKQRGDYECTFVHDLPAGAREHDANGDGVGSAWFVVGPADRSGWYMTVLLDCGG